MSSIQAYKLKHINKKEHWYKQGAQTRGTRHIFPSISGCMIIVGYTNHLGVGRVAEYPLRLFDLKK